MKEKKFGNNLKVNLIVLLVVTIIYNVLCIFLSQNQNYSIRYEFAFDYKIIILWIVNYVAIIFALIFFDKLKKNIGYVTFAIGVLAMFVLLDIGIFSIGKIFGGIIILNSIIYLSNYDIVNGNKEIDLIEEEKSFHKNKKKLKINLIIQLCINVVLGILIIIAYLNSKTSIIKI